MACKTCQIAGSLLDLELDPAVIGGEPAVLLKRSHSEFLIRTGLGPQRSYLRQRNALARCALS
jgi:hypothetical protein